MSLFDAAQKELARAPQDGGALRTLAQVENGRAILLGSTQPERALEYHAAALQWLSKLSTEDAADLETRRLRASILANTGWAEGQARRYEESIAHTNEAIAILKDWAGADPANSNALYQLSGVYRSLGIVNGYKGDGAQAAEAFARAADVHRRLIALDPKNTVYRFLRAELLMRRSQWLVKAGRTGEARSNAVEGLAILRELADAPRPALSHLFGACRWMTETDVRDLRDAVHAAAYCRQAIGNTRGQDPDAWMGLAEAQSQMGDRAGAIESAKKAVALLPRA